MCVIYPVHQYREWLVKSRRTLADPEFSACRRNHAAVRAVDQVPGGIVTPT